MEIKTKLYLNLNLFQDNEKEIEYYFIKINKKIINYFLVPDHTKGVYNGYQNNDHFFTYIKDNKYSAKFPILKLNYQIKIYPRTEDPLGDDSNVANITGYVHLNYIQAFILDWNHNSTFIHEPENIKFIFKTIIIPSVVFLIAFFLKGRL